MSKALKMALSLANQHVEDIRCTRRSSLTWSGTHSTDEESLRGNYMNINGPFSLAYYEGRWNCAEGSDDGCLGWKLYKNCKHIKQALIT